MSETCPMCGSGLASEFHRWFLCDSAYVNDGFRQSEVCKDRQIAALTQRAEQAERERDEAMPFMLAVKDAHNGYDTATREALHDLQEPPTPEQALRELDAEWEAMLTDATDRLTAAESELKRLREGIEAAMRIKDLWAPTNDWPVEHTEEAQALEMMRFNFEALLAQPSGGKEAEDASL